MRQCTVVANHFSPEQQGSEHRDLLTPEGFVGNNAGGVLGGISSGQDVLVSLALKPTSSIRQPGASVDTQGKPIEVATHGRHDPCVVPRAVPIVEALTLFTLADLYLISKTDRL